MTINECSKCGLKGYKYQDPIRRLCHLCINIERANKPILDSLLAIRQQLINEWNTPWPGVEHGKALLGQSINDAIHRYE